MDFINWSYWLKILAKIIGILFLCSQSACFFIRSKDKNSRPVFEIKKEYSHTLSDANISVSVTTKEDYSKLSDPNSSLTGGIDAPFSDYVEKADSSQDAGKSLVLNRDIVRATKSAPIISEVDKSKVNTTDEAAKAKADTRNGLESDRPSFTLKKAYTGTPIALDFQDADVRSVLRIISEISNYNLVIDPDVSGKVTIALHNPVPWDQALEIILKTNRLASKMEGNIIRIGMQKTFTQEEESNLKAIEAQQQTERAEKKAVPLKTEIIPVNYAQAGKLKDHITPMLSKAEGSSESPSVTIDDRTNSLIIKDLPENIDKVKKVLADLDKETPQVMIEIRIVETTKKFTKELGVRWGGTYGKETSYRFPRTIGANYAVNLPNEENVFGGIGVSLGHINKLVELDLTLDAMESDGKGRIISNPRIATLDNEKAVIQSGTKIPYAAVDEEGNVTVKFEDAKIQLEVTPHITPNDSILLDIMAEKSEPDWSNKVKDSPSIIQRKADTKLIVKDGDTTVIGGLYLRSQSNKERKVPWFGNVPFMGWLFKAKLINEAYDELLIFITPKVMTKSGD